jgi:predicted small secreted protein
MTLPNPIRRAALALLACVPLAACDNPVSPGEHIKPAGIAIRDGATTVVQVMGTTVTGGLAVQAGQQSPPLTVHFLASGGNEMTPPHGYYLNVVSKAAGTATWVQATPGEFAGRLQGIAAGTATLEFQWVHGAVGSGHVDERFEIDVVVTP